MSSDVVTVFRGSPMDAEIIQEVLADNGIITHMKNQLMGSIAPWQVAAGGFDPVELEVLQKDAKKALDWINEFKKNE